MSSLTANLSSKSLSELPPNKTKNNNKNTMFDKPSEPEYVGKVRNVYYPKELSSVIILEHTDKLSAYDSHICNVNGKGNLLNLTNVFWMNNTKHIVPNHYISHNGSYILAKRTTPIKIEFIVRGYITGSSKTSLWTLYQENKHDVYGITLPKGLQKHQKLNEPVITPTTKGDIDIPISEEYILNTNLLTKDQWKYISSKAKALYQYGYDYCLTKGLILVDTKYEFGIDSNGHIMLIDECHTCDSSRYWMVDTYQSNLDNGKDPQSIDKDQIRRYINKEYPDFKNLPLLDRPAVIIPEEVKTQLFSSYAFLLNTLTSKLVGEPIKFVESSDSTNYSSILQEYYNNEAPKIIIMSGSISDAPKVNKVADYCTENGIVSKIYYHSAHKEPKVVLQLIEKLNGQIATGRKMVIIAVVGMSNALGGVLGANMLCPVINCPMFADRVDMMVNIHSNIQMPSRVPVATILSDRNAVLFAKKILNM